MEHSSRESKPVLLMASHCVPDAVGGIDRVRAWQLLKLAAQTHQVYLACVSDGPVNLAQWRTVHDQVQQVTIETNNVLRSRDRRWSLWPDNRRRRHRKTNTVLAQPIIRWSRDQTFDAILCTHPKLWSEVRTIDARLRICDLNFESATAHPRRRRHRYRHEHRIAAEVDLFTLSRRLDQGSLVNQFGRTIELPLRIDPDFFTHVRASQLTRRQAQPGLGVAFHSQWDHRAPQSSLSWFGRRVWPSVRRAVPDAQLWHTLPGVSEPFATMLDASVVICPDAQPCAARLPVLQAMAMQRAVIASGSAMDCMNLGLHHGKHLLLSRHERDWIEHCIELLRSASARLRLSRHAHTWIQHYATIEQTGHKLTQTLSNVGTTLKPLHRAA